MRVPLVFLLCLSGCAHAGGGNEFTGIITRYYAMDSAHSFVATEDGRCVPILLSPEQSRRWLQDRAGRYTLSGDLIDRLPEGADTQRTLYRDRWLMAETCPESDQVLYVRRMRIAK